MFQLFRTKVFDRDVEHYSARGGNMARLERVLRLLQTGGKLPPWLRDHALQGRLRHLRELHVMPDWLLVYQRDGKCLRVFCIWLVSHKKLQERERSL